MLCLIPASSDVDLTEADATDPTLRDKNGQAVECQCDRCGHVHAVPLRGPGHIPGQIEDGTG